MKKRFFTKRCSLYGHFAALKCRRIFTLILSIGALLGGSARAQLLHRYDFNTTNDTVGTADGTLEGGATISGGSLNTGAGTDGGLSGGVPLNGMMLPSAAVAGITNAFTIETWFKANYNGGYCTVFSFSDSTTANYVLATPARGNSPYASSISVVGGGGSYTGPGDIEAGEQYQDNANLHEMVVTYDGTTLSYYIDGALGSSGWDAANGVSPTITDPGLNLSTLTYIGINGGSPYADNSINGANLDFRIYGQALTAAQVANMYILGSDASNSAISNAIAPPTSFVWDGGGADNNWSTALNWLSGIAPALSGASLTFAGSARTSPDMNAGYSVTGLTFSNNASSFTIVTTNSSTLTLAGNVVNNSTSAQTFDVPVALSVAASLNAASGNLLVNSNITLGASALTLMGSGNFIVDGNVAGSGSFTMSGSGILTLGATNVSAGDVSFNNGTTLISGTVSSAGATTYIGYLTGNGVVNMSGGTLNTAGEVRVGGSDQNGSSIIGTGNFTMSGGAANLGSLSLARGNYLDNTESGTVTLNSGSTMISSNDVIIEFAGKGLGKLALNGGSFIIGPTTTQWIRIGVYDSGSGELDITNGNLFLENNSSLKMCQNGNTGGNVVNQMGGAVTFYSDAGVTVGGSGNLDLNLGGGSSSSSTYNLIGGTLTVPQIVASSSFGSGTFNFEGGTLKVSASTATLMQGASSVNVMAAGAVIDTAGNNVAVAQELFNGDGLGGGLTKIDSGTLTLASGYAYSGPTVVEGGTLALDAAQSSSGSDVSVTNATLSVSLGNGTSSLEAGNLTFAGNTALDFNFGSATSPSAYAIIASGVTVHITGTNTINIAGSALQAGQYPLIYTGGSVPTNHFTLGALPTGLVAVLTNSGVSLDLLVTASGQVLTWYGADSSGNPLTVWNINTSSNWNSGTAKYLQYDGNSYGDNVTFDDTLYSPSGANITLNTTVVPVDVTFNNNATAYSITGSGGIGGATAVTMNGSATTYLGTTNSYAGGTVINAGTLSVVNDQALGVSTAPVTVANSTLQFSNSTASSRGINVISNSTIDVAANATVQLSGAVSGLGTFTKSDLGALTLAGPERTASTFVNAGILNLAGAETNTTVIVGNAPANTTMNISGALTANNLIAGNVSGAVGAVYQTGGLVNLTFNTGFDNLDLGNVPGSSGYYEASGGALAVNGICLGGEGNNGVSSSFGVSGDGVLEVNGGTVNDIGWFVLARNNFSVGGAEIGLLNVYSGLLTYAGGGMVGPWDTGESAIINILGGAVTNTAGVGVYLGNTGYMGILNLNGGLLQASVITGYNGPTYAPVPGGQLNFNGGTLRASAANANFIAVANADVYGGGATIDDGGQVITISQPLLAPAGYGVSSVTLSDGGSGYIAPPIVLISGGAGSNATVIAQINMATGTITNLIVTSPGTGYIPGDTLTAAFSDGGSAAVAPVTATVNLAANASGGLTKIGNGTMTLNGTNTYTGPTTVNAGTLAGTGAIAGSLTNKATLAPGAGGTGSLTVNGGITLLAASTNIFAVNGTTLTNASVIAGSSVAYGGVLEIVPSGTFAANQQFQLFSGSGAMNTGNFASIAGSPGIGLAFSFTNGVLSVLSAGPSSPAHITNSVSGNILSLTWPAGQGWRLVSQTNSLSTGLNTNAAWKTAPGASDGSATITINPAMPTVFYRLTYP